MSENCSNLDSFLLLLSECLLVLGGHGCLVDRFWCNVLVYHLGRQWPTAALLQATTLTRHTSVIHSTYAHHTAVIYQASYHLMLVLPFVLSNQTYFIL